MEVDESLRSNVLETMEQVKSKYREIIMSMEFGVYFMPENYFVAYIFDTDKKLEYAKESGLIDEINEYHKGVLREKRYPAEGIKDCSFDSKETCDREYNGNWFYYYK